VEVDSARTGREIDDITEDHSWYTFAKCLDMVDDQDERYEPDVVCYLYI
jgi:hypothetical protein